MEIKINIDLAAIIAQAVSADRVQPIIEKAIRECIVNAINDATGWRSPFSEALKKQFTDALPHGISTADCVKFQHMLNAAVASAVNGENTKTIQAALDIAVKSVLPDIPSTIKLSELIKLARAEFSKEQYESFYACLVMSEYGGGSLYLDSDESTRLQYQADTHIQFNKTGQVFALKMDGLDITASGTPSVISCFDSTLMALYVGRTSLEIDLDSNEVEYAAAPQDD